MTQSLEKYHLPSNPYFVSINWKESSVMRGVLLEKNPLFDPLTKGFVVDEEFFLFYKLNNFHGCQWKLMERSKIPLPHEDAGLWNHFGVRLFSDFIQQYEHKEQ